MLTFTGAIISSNFFFLFFLASYSLDASVSVSASASMVVHPRLHPHPHPSNRFLFIPSSSLGSRLTILRARSRVNGRSRARLFFFRSFTNSPRLSRASWLSAQNKSWRRVSIHRSSDLIICVKLTFFFCLNPSQLLFKFYCYFSLPDIMGAYLCLAEVLFASS